MGYRGKLVEQQQARDLRTQGWTLAAIAERLGVSKGSVSAWVRDVAFEPRGALVQRRARQREPNALQRRKAAEIEELLEQGKATVGTLTEREFLMAGIALYAGEGAKRDGDVKFANTNGEMVGFFCRWLRHFFDVDEQRLRVALYLHEGLDLEVAISYWSGITRVPPSQFTKPYRAAPDGGIRHSKYVHGCAAVRYSCARTHRAIMGLVAAMFGDAGLG